MLLIAPGLQHSLYLRLSDVTSAIPLPKRLLPLIQTLVPLPACLPGTIFGRLISSLLAEADLARLLLNICGSEAPIAVSAF